MLDTAQAVSGDAEHGVDSRTRRWPRLMIALAPTTMSAILRNSSNSPLPRVWWTSAVGLGGEVGHAREVEDRQVLGIGAGHRADRAEFADAVGGADGADTADAGVAVGGVGSIEFIAAANPVDIGMRDDRVLDGKAKSPGTPKISVTPMSWSRPSTWSMTVVVVMMKFLRSEVELGTASSDSTSGQHLRPVPRFVISWPRIHAKRADDINPMNVFYLYMRCIYNLPRG